VFNARLAGSQEFPGGRRLLLARITQHPIAVVKPRISNRISVAQKIKNHRTSMTGWNTHH
jgi:hypothetical protein